MLMVLVMLSGCVVSRHQVTIESLPPGATVRQRGHPLKQGTPVELHTWWLLVGCPGGRIQIRAPGYRSTDLRLCRGVGRQVAIDWALLWMPTAIQPLEFGHAARLMGLQTRHPHQVHLVRRHGQAGTWTEEDAHRLK